MSEARDRVLNAVRRAVKRDADGTAAVEARLVDHPRNLVPARAAELSRPEQIALFEDQATQVSTSVSHVPEPAAVPKAVAGFLKAENLPAEVRMAPDPELEALPWNDQPLLTVSRGPARDADPVSVTAAVLGVAETGTVILHSGPAGPTTLNFLPETHVVVLETRRIVASYEDAWDELRSRFGSGTMPRTVNFVTGPSRSADIEQTIQLGAHGPRRLHIILVGGETN